MYYLAPFKNNEIKFDAMPIGKKKPSKKQINAFEQAMEKYNIPFDEIRILNTIEVLYGLKRG